MPFVCFENLGENLLGALIEKASYERSFQDKTDWNANEHGREEAAYHRPQGSFWHFKVRVFLPNYDDNGKRSEKAKEGKQ